MKVEKAENIQAERQTGKLKDRWKKQTDSRGRLAQRKSIRFEIFRFIKEVVRLISTPGFFARNLFADSSQELLLMCDSKSLKYVAESQNPTELKIEVSPSKEKGYNTISMVKKDEWRKKSAWEEEKKTDRQRQAERQTKGIQWNRPENRIQICYILLQLAPNWIKYFYSIE